ncbi:cytochrome c [uncultured Thiodictyon sp.]|uniref:c-type cytochrome n=1 Tax=uncultured Thiodictyon sp. TaxID=1846217 RepID=UPI0025FFCDA9|nr:cytochrome c [uncultured Thiodictyon sp.]
MTALAWLAGCDSGRQGQGGGDQFLAKAEVGRIPAYPQRPGDAQKGYDVLVNRAALTCGLPYNAYAKAVARSKPRGAPGPQFPGRSGRNRELPYMLSAHQAPSGVELVSTNCLACHAATLDGRLIMGLGNAFLDMTQDPAVEIAATGALVTGQAERAQWRRWSERITRLSGDLLTDTVGVNTAAHSTLALMAQHDPKTLAWSDKPLLAPPPQPALPVAIPPWWNLRKKHALFYSGEGRGDLARHLLLANTTCTDSVAEASAMDLWFVDIRAYLATLAPPKYPYAIDQALAERGYSLYRSQCQGCHGTNGEDWRYPNLVVPLGEVGTDPALARATYNDLDRFRAWFRQSYYGERSQLTPALGYVAPPLDGVWATAPYLHNDAVPTLAALLDPSARPAYWRARRTADGAPIYDPESLGWAYDTLSQGKSAAMSWDECDQVYDSTGKGYGNGGHRFGDTLSAADRRALIEYLKTL